MKAATNTLRICSQGHQYHKSSDCPTCPICEAARKPKDGFLSLISAPARRALEGADITTLAKLSAYSERELLAMHGVGPSTIPTLRSALAAQGLSFSDHQ
ncbi:RNA polymerase alpha subunit C-terminal domain-containing protein [Parapedobacter tibetensis]|uniref:RNA polymerase alpha subunit C-terminal domain-containing protein n=1 Tax=Parapedobacter tibetensis TaxID=2972951 RepID=UPI00214D946F|nr:RNA polymerase alpha subunit C-terminal domain-containing protein [Parapedobacter tibetensis]